MLFSSSKKGQALATLENIPKAGGKASHIPPSQLSIFLSMVPISAQGQRESLYMWPTMPLVLGGCSHTQDNLGKTSEAHMSFFLLFCKKLPKPNKIHMHNLLLRRHKLLSSAVNSRWTWNLTAHE